MTTDKIRKQIANVQYDDYSDGDIGRLIYADGVDKPIGILRRVIADDTGLNAYVIEDPKTGHITVLYRGSEGPGESGLKAEGKFSRFIQILV